MTGLRRQLIRLAVLALFLGIGKRHSASGS